MRSTAENTLKKLSFAGRSLAGVDVQSPGRRWWSAWLRLVAGYHLLPVTRLMGPSEAYPAVHGALLPGYYCCSVLLIVLSPAASSGQHLVPVRVLPGGAPEATISVVARALMIYLSVIVLFSVSSSAGLVVFR